jgi:chromosome segregation ATPase
MSDIVDRLRHPASVFYEYSADNGALLEQAVDEIERLRKDFATAEHEMKVVDQNRIFLQKEYERWMSIAQSQSAHIAKLNEAIGRYVETVVYCEGVTFIDGVEDEWAKLIESISYEWIERMGEKK